MGSNVTSKQPVPSAYNAGFASFRARDPEHSIACALWYPTHDKAKAFSKGVYDLVLAKNAACVETKHPLIIISHGSGGTRFDHCKTAVFLAQNGFFVLALEHPHNNFFDDRGIGSVKTYQDRSRHLKSCLDSLLLSDEWSSFIDQDRIGVFGFSLGGYSALTAVGAQPHVEGLREHCRINREFDPIFTGYEVIIQDGFTETHLPVHADPRYKACIALAPVSGGLFPKDSLKDISIPVQIFRAEHDMILRHPFHSTEIHRNLGSTSEFHNLENAGHFSFLSPARADAKDSLGEFAHDNPGFDRTKAHDKIHRLILNFLHKSLS